MIQVEVFKTNVATKRLSLRIAACLASLYEGAQVTFDLEDIDHILRIASPQQVETDLVEAVVKSFGFQAEVLPDEVSVPASGAEVVRPLRVV